VCVIREHMILQMILVCSRPTREMGEIGVYIFFIKLLNYTLKMV